MNIETVKSTRAFVLGASLLAVSCVSTSKIYGVGPGIYSVASSGDGYSTAGRTKDHVLGAATAFCDKKGQHVLVVNEDKSRTRMGIDTTIDVRFRCVSDQDGG